MNIFNFGLLHWLHKSKLYVLANHKEKKSLNLN